ncbi:MAG TPA: glycosyltransferase family 2 protein [Tepidisphaeraceae bacterium]|nr:glycosyltransferase family 2 protein [Tepidisphaeraceae bacterium]
MKLLIIIVNYRTSDLVIDCLRSLRDEIGTVPPFKVIVVENASDDDSARRIADAIASNEWQSWAELLPLGTNGGFAAGNNAAIRAALAGPDVPDFFLLLNPDTVVRPGAVRALVDFMDRRPDAGIVGSRLENLDGTPQISAFRFPSVLGELEAGIRIGLISRVLARWTVSPPIPSVECKTDWVAGASMMIRHQVFETIGLLDERYFMYFEEVDFCRRASRAGWPCWYVPQSRVVHLVGQSSGVTNAAQSRRRRPRYWFEARRLFFLRHYGPFRTLLADLFWAAGYAVWRVRRAVFRRPDNDPERLLSDFVGYNLIGIGRRSAAR